MTCLTNCFSTNWSQKYGDNSSNVSKECDDYFSAVETEQHLYTPASSWCTKIGLPIILTFGLLGNSAFLFLLYRARTLRTPAMRQMLNETNFYLANLAVADIGYLTVAGTRYLIDIYKTPLNLSYPFDTGIGCALPTFIVYTTYFSSVWLITLVAFERYLAICRTFKHRGMRSTRRSLMLVGMAWVSATMMASFSTSWKSVDICIEWPPGEAHANLPAIIQNCFFTCDWCELFLIILDCGQFIFAFILNLFFYVKIIRTLRSRPLSSRSRSASTASTRSRSESTTSATRGRSLSTLSAILNSTISPTVEERQSVETQSRQVALMLIINAMIFFLCLFPFAVVNNMDAMVYRFTGDEISILETILPEWVGWFGKMTALINSAVNPYIFSLLNRKYRLAFREAFQFCTCYQDV